MPMSQTHYLPLTPVVFAILFIVVAGLMILIQLNVLRYAFMRLGLSSQGAFLLLIGSLVGSYFNIPVAMVPGQHVTGQIVHIFGMDYVIPHVVDWPGTVIAVNVGGAVIPVLMSAYLLIRYGVWLRAAIATAIVAAIIHALANPVPGLGIAVPVFAPALITAITAMLLSRATAPQIAYIAGSLGTLIGADLLNLDKIGGLGAPVASIGGAGTFDGIFLTGILSVLLASITSPRPNPGLR
ncbi:MAG: DUF1614 domain-containing protein [Xanthobacteraceae bacterium]|nr:DUF1614 domain-containing protein [Xanthobacteraceae bacterium]